MENKKYYIKVPVIKNGKTVWEFVGPVASEQLNIGTITTLYRKSGTRFRKSSAQ